ncbi:extracellular solute-binding protein [Paenibacillus hodogayensis]|uniref:Extracellular solute-binding protein n=1 Tax=Paenibacillus hodogayensis TaxID=279208 RepID=A0ABV5VXQ0_9BACL
MKWTGYVSALAATMVVLAGCGGGNGGQPEGSGQATGGETKKGETSVPQRPARSGPLEITMYSAGAAVTQEGFNDMYGDALRKKFPDVKFTFIPKAKGSEIQDLVTSGTTVDVIFDSIGYQATLKNLDLQTDLTPLIKNFNLDLNKFEQTTIDYQRNNGNGSIRGLPVWTATAGLYYNKDIFDKFGVAYPKDGMTWSELLELSKKLTRQDGGIQYVGFVTSQASQATTNQLGLKFIDPKTGKTQLESDGWKKVLNTLVPFYQIPGPVWDSNTIAVAAQRAMFEKDRTAAMYTNYSGGTPPADMNWDIVSVPYYDEAKGVGAQSYPAYLSISRMSKNPNLAFEVIEFLVSEPYQLENTQKGRATVLNNPDILKQYGANDAKFKGKNIAAMFPPKRAVLGDYTPEDTAASAQFSNAFNAVVIGHKDVNTALREAAEAADKAIEALRAAKK